MLEYGWSDVEGCPGPGLAPGESITYDSIKPRDEAQNVAQLHLLGSVFTPLATSVIISIISLTIDYRLSATTFGRPVLHCGPNLVPLPQAIDDEYLLEVGEGRQPDDKPSRMSFFIQSIALFDILNDILTKFYSHPNRSQAEMPSEYLTEIPRLCSRLEGFLDGLPQHLKIQQNSEKPGGPANCFQVQSQILKSRYYSLQTK